MEETTPDYAADVRRDLPRQFLVEVDEAFRTAAKQAKAVIRNSHEGIDGGIPLGARRGNRAAGLLRFQINDEAFEQIVTRHGGAVIGSVKVEGHGGPELAPIYLTTARFGATLVGFASHYERDDLPAKNASRKALCAQNVGLSLDLYRAPELYVDRERYVLVMVQRDHSDIGAIASMTLTIVDPTFSHFVLKSDLNDFLASYGGTPKAAPTFKLRDAPGRFRNPGAKDDKAEGADD